MADVPNTTAAPMIPYGRADFRGIRLDASLYVDKTAYIAVLERHRYVLFIRPRRFGKTCWLSTLRSYYDRCEKDTFKAVFDGTAIGSSPTPNRSRYVVLWLDLSAFGLRIDHLDEDFAYHCFQHLRATLEQNGDLFPADVRERILAAPTVAGQINEFFLRARERDIPIYVLIDEYDNLANNILAWHGEDAYQAFTHEEGFFRAFFTTLKSGASSGALERLFVTGVSPVAMDDVTSGFNIGRNLSLDPALSAMVGFTEDEVRRVLNIYHDAGETGEHPDEALATMRQWYNGYRFAEEAEEDVYNPDMVLYYLAESLGRSGPPLELIDDNVRVDYGKLRHLLTVGGRLNGNFNLLRTAMTDGRAECRVKRSFPQREIDDRDNFLSLLHYFGLLSIRPDAPGEPELVVPNQTAHQLLHAFLRDAYRDVGAFSVYIGDLERLMRRMAQHGEWREALDFLAEAIRAQSGAFSGGARGACPSHEDIRDYLREEKMVQGFLAAYLGATDHFLFSTEREFGKGFVDFCLEPFTARHPQARHGYLIELKYVKREDDEAKLDAALAEAKAQLERYLADDTLQEQGPDVTYTGLAIVFHGWELARCEAVG